MTGKQYQPWVWPVSGERGVEAANSSEARQFLKLLRGRLSERIEQLSILIQSDPEFFLWQPDRSNESVRAVGAWFLKHGRTRPLVDLEGLSGTVPDWAMSAVLREQAKIRVLTDESMQYARDAAVYLGEVFRERIAPTLECPWRLGLSGGFETSRFDVIASPCGRAGFSLSRVCWRWFSRLLEKEMNPDKLVEHLENLVAETPARSIELAQYYAMCAANERARRAERAAKKAMKAKKVKE